MKKLFFTGLIILLPITLTIGIVVLLIDLFTMPFQGIVESFLRHYNFLDEPFFIFSREQTLYFVSKFVILALLFVFTVFVGILGRQVFVNSLFKVGSKILYRIPLVNKLYKTLKEVSTTMFGTKKTTFSKVVLIPFPHATAYSIGLVATTHANTILNGEIPVFLPTSPNPMFGVVLKYKYEDIVFLDMKVDDALKFVLSGGIMFSEYKILSVLRG